MMIPKKVVVAIGLFSLCLAVALLGVLVRSNMAEGKGHASGQDLSAAYGDCVLSSGEKYMVRWITLADEHTITAPSLTVDSETMSAVGCMLHELHAGPAVLNRFIGTTVQAGSQHASAAGVTYDWSLSLGDAMPCSAYYCPDAPQIMTLTIQS